MAKNRRDNPTLAAHVAEASGAEQKIESNLAAHLLLITRSQHQALLERQLDASRARVERLNKRLVALGGSVRSVPKPSRPAKNVKGAAKAAERRATKIATGSARKVRDAGELRRVLEAARQEQQEALKQSATYQSLRALAKASDDKDTAKLAKSLRDEHRDWASFLKDELNSLSKKLVKAEKQERDAAASNRRSASAKRSAKSGPTRSRKSTSSSRRKSSASGGRKTAASTKRKSSASGGRKTAASGGRKTAASNKRRSSASSGRRTGSTARKSSSSGRKRASSTKS